MAKGSGGLVLGLIAVGGLAALVLSSKSASAAPAGGGSGGTQPGGGSSPGPLVANGCTLDANMPPAMVSMVTSLLSPAYTFPPATYAALAAKVLADGYPQAAACLNAKASQGGYTPDPGTGGIPANVMTQTQADLYNALVANGENPANAQQLAAMPGLQTFYQLDIAGGMSNTAAAQAALAQLSAITPSGR